MRILTRYYLQRFFFRFATVLGAMGVVYLGIETIEKLRWLSDRRMETGPFFALMWDRIPQALSFLLPLACLIGCTLTIVTLNVRHELTAIRAAGRSPRRLLVPVLLGALLAGIAQWTVTELWLPQASRHQRMLLETSRPSGPQQGSSAGQWQLYNGALIRIGSFPGDGEIRDIELIRMDSSQRIRQHLLASRAHWDGQKWTATDVRVQTTNAAGAVKYEHPATQRLELTAPPEVLREQNPEPEGLTYRGLEQAIGQLRAGGRKAPGLSAALHLRWILPLSCILLVLVGFPLTARPSAGLGGTGAVGLSLGIASLYFLATGTGAILGRSGAVSLAVGLWTPQVLWLFMGGILSSRIK